MHRHLGRFAPHSFAALRIMAGVLFALHGTQKLFGFPGDQPPAGAELMIVAGVIEAGAGILIAVGYMTSWAALLASGEMAAAYFIAHFPRGFWPILNKGELAVVYCFLFLYIAAHGGGRWSADGEGRDEGRVMSDEG
jgi:putative oxidoreductase